MRVLVSEHALLAELVREELLEYDPDYPMDATTEPPRRVSHAVESALLLARHGEPFSPLLVLTPKEYEQIERISADPFLLKILELPFETIHVVDNQGTLVLTFSETQTT